MSWNIDKEDFNELRQLASSTCLAWGYADLAKKFILCDSTGEFAQLCSHLEEWGGANPIGEYLEQQLREKKIQNYIADEISDNLLDNP